MNINIDSILNKVIKVLMVAILCIMLIIGLLFISPVYVHALDSDYSFVDYSGNGSTFDSSTGVFTQSYNASAGTNFYNIFRYIITKYNNTYYSGTLTLVDPSALGNFKIGSSNIYVTCDSSVNTTISVNSNTYVGAYKDITTGDTFNIYEAFAFNPEPNGYVSNQGTFLTLSQVNSNISVDYDETAISGSLVYANNSTYCFLGQYQNATAPTSQYTYVQTETDSYIPVVFSSVPLTVYRAFINGQTLSSSVCVEYDNGKYYSIFNQFASSNEFSTLGVTPFASLSDAQNAFSGASYGASSGVVSAGALSIDVPAGNVLYVKTRPGSIGRLTVQFPVKSAQNAPYWTSRNSTAKWISGISSLPDENTTFPLSGMSDINWVVDTSKSVDGYGRSYYGKADHAPFVSGWFVVFNPAYTNSPTDDVIGGNTATFNPTITVNLQYALEYHIYDLSEAILPSGNVSTSLSDFSTSWGGSYDPDNDDWDTDNQNTSTEEPVVGGLNSGAEGGSLSITEYLQYLGETLSEFANDVVSLFTAPISHIRQLISAGSAFMSAISQFFVWLPEPVYVVITSALVVAVVIGVIKLLL